MFSDEYITGVDVKSSWKSGRKQRENGSQTSEILTYEADSQTSPAVESGAQTVSPIDLLQNAQSQADQSYDPVSLTTFLATVEPLISKQLKKNSAYNVFKELSWGEDPSSSDVSIILEHTLNERSIKSTGDKDDTALEVTSLSWSGSGGSIAVAYGSMKDMPWGQAGSYLCIWNLTRAKLNLNKCDQKLEVESSLQSVAFHTSNPSLIAGGLFSGNVILWDLSQEDSATSGSESHEDPVTAIAWLEPTSRKHVNLMSASTDGKLIIWKQRISRSKQPLQVAKKFQIKASSVRGSSRARGTGSVGVTCCAVAVPVQDGIEMSTGDERTLIAGCENGAVVKCSINEDSVEDDPVVFSYKAHLGPVYSVDWSPFHRHIFLSCSTDQRVRFYHSLYASPLREVTPYPGPDQYLFASKWSPACEMMLYSAGHTGMFAAYDASKEYLVNSVESEGQDGKSCRINCLEVNRKRMEYVATGNAEGTVHIWQMGSKYTSTDTEAKEGLNRMAEEAMTED